MFHKHKPETRRPWRGDGANWYRTKAWLNLRAWRLGIEPPCRKCQARQRAVAASVVDHVTPHRGVWALFIDPENTQSLCALCHNSTKQREERKGHTVGCTNTGRPLDPDHPWNKKRGQGGG